LGNPLFADFLRETISKVLLHELKHLSNATKKSIERALVVVSESVLKTIICNSNQNSFGKGNDKR